MVGVILDQFLTGAKHNQTQYRRSSCKFLIHLRICKGQNWKFPDFINSFIFFFFLFAFNLVFFHCIFLYYTSRLVSLIITELLVFYAKLIAQFSSVQFCLEWRRQGMRDLKSRVSSSLAHTGVRLYR